LFANLAPVAARRQTAAILGFGSLRRSAEPPLRPLTTPLVAGEVTSRQKDTNSVSSLNWSNVTSGVQDDGTNKTMVINPPAGNRFYRLHKP
jgi:hypothetical protein